MAAKATKASLWVFNQQLAQYLKDKGYTPMTTGTTVVNPADDFETGVAFAQREIERAKQTFGPRAADRYTNTIGSSYREERFKLIANLESFSGTPYPDAGNTAVAYGFAMNKPGARDVWKAAFGDSISFDAVMSGKRPLTKAEGRQLFDHDILYFEKVIDKASGGRQFTQNQRLALVSVAYTTPSRVASWAPVLQNGTPEQIADQILHNSFKPGHPHAEGLKKRRYTEATLFLSPSEAETRMATFDVYNSAVQVDNQTGVARIRAVGTADIDNLDREFEARIANLFADAPEHIRSGFEAYSGYRSVEKQAQLFNDAVRKYGSVDAARKWVAPPGKSAHNHGMAADLSWNGQRIDRAPAEVRQYLHQNAERYGLSFPLSNEAWHIEPVEWRQGKALVPRAHLRPVGEAAPIPASVAERDKARANVPNFTGLPQGAIGAVAGNSPVLVKDLSSNVKRLAEAPRPDLGSLPAGPVAGTYRDQNVPSSTTIVRKDGTQVRVPLAGSNTTPIPRPASLPDPGFDPYKAVGVNPVAASAAGAKNATGGPDDRGGIKAVDPVAPVPKRKPAWMTLTSGMKFDAPPNLAPSLNVQGPPVASAPVTSAQPSAGQMAVRSTITTSPQQLVQIQSGKVVATGNYRVGGYNYNVGSDGTITNTTTGRVTSGPNKRQYDPDTNSWN